MDYSKEYFYMIKNEVLKKLIGGKHIFNSGAVLELEAMLCSHWNWNASHRIKVQAKRNELDARELRSIQEVKSLKGVKHIYSKLNNLHKKIFDKYLELSKTRVMHQQHGNIRSYKRKDSFESLESIFGFALGLFTYQDMDIDIIDYLKGEKYCATTDFIDGKYFACLFSIEEGKKAFKMVFDMVYNNENLLSFSNHIIKGMILSDNEDGNKMAKDLLLSAQRSEGLRQAIVETIDLADIETFKEFLKIIVDENLGRFSSVKRAFLTYTGLEYTVEDSRCIDIIIKGVHSCLVQGKTKDYLESQSALEFYIGLYSLACEELTKGLEYACENFDSFENHKKITAIEFMRNCGRKIPMELILNVCKKMDNANQTAYLLAKISQNNILYQEQQERRDMISFISSWLWEQKKIPKKCTSVFDSSKSITFEMDSAIKSMIKNALYIDDMYEEAYKHLDRLSYIWKSDTELFPSIKNQYMRKALLDTLKSNKESMRDFGEDSIIRFKLAQTLTQEECDEIGGFLKTKRSSAKKKICKVLQKAEPEKLLITCGKLLEDKNKEKQKGAISILAENRERFEKFEEYDELLKKLQNMEIEDEVKSTVVSLGHQDEEDVTEIRKSQLFDANYRPEIGGLKYDDELINRYLNPDKKKLIGFVKEVAEIHKSLVGVEYEAVWHDGSKHKEKFGFESSYLGNKIRVIQKGEGMKHYMRYCFYDKFLHLNEQFSEEQLIFFFDYMKIIGRKKYNDDEFRLISKHEIVPDMKNVDKALDEEFDGDDNYSHYIGSCEAVLEILSHYRKDQDEEFENRNIDICREIFAYKVKRFDEKIKSKNREEIYRHMYAFIDRSLAQISEGGDISFRSPAEVLNIFLYREKMLDRKMNNIDVKYLLYFVEQGVLKKDYIYQLAFDTEIRSYNQYSYNAKETNSRKFIRDVDWMIKRGKAPELLKEIYRNTVDIMVEKELERTEAETDFSNTLKSASTFYGAETFVKTLVKMGKTPFVRGWNYSDGKKDIFSRIVSGCELVEEDTQEKFNKLVKESKIKEKKLLEAAMYNLNFIDLVQGYLQIDGLKKAAYYFKAHMNERLSEKDQKIIRRYTDLEFEGLKDGAFDKRWFLSSFEELGEKNFKKLYDAAKYIASGGNHKRAQYYADGLLGKMPEEEVERRIDDKRNTDMILVYGVLPLGDNKKEGALRRYRALQKFLKESRQFGSQRRATESRKVGISMSNLSRNYGIDDVTRFSWSMEIELVKEIEEMFQEKEIEEIKVFISLDKPSSPEIVVVKGEKKLKNVPAKLKKNEYIMRLKEAKKQLKEQYSRARLSLENAMINEDEFTYSEIKDLYNHPVISRILENILFINGDEVGFINTSDDQLDGLNGMIELREMDKLRILHPHDLHKLGVWVKWQNHIMDTNIKQPFKQVFRELYSMTEEEQENDGFTNRFAGYQVQPKKTLGVLKSRGWLIDEYNGFEKINHKSNLRIDLYCYADWFTPSEIESPSLEMIKFIDNKTGKTMDMKEVSPILFSETMRDIDLVVSVAYVGGVDPLMNHSTVEMRKRIIHHNMKLFKIKNYDVGEKYVNIQGEFGNYSVHLGSGVATMEGKGMIPVFPVHSQHRGHIFLPFVDEDPKTAEIISKVLALAKDNKIKDPKLLQFIR